jgi:hypothetical protein
VEVSCSLALSNKHIAPVNSKAGRKKAMESLMQMSSIEILTEVSIGGNFIVLNFCSIPEIACKVYYVIHKRAA